jgi:hypothetical protein
VLSNAGDQVPVMLLFDVVGKAFKVAPAQIEATCVNVGVTIGLTVIVIVAVEAHCPAVGVNVYVVVVVLSNAGDQVPVMLLFDVVGRALKVSPEQIADTCVIHNGHPQSGHHDWSCHRLRRHHRYAMSSHEMCKLTS